MTGAASMPKISRRRERRLRQATAAAGIAGLGRAPDLIIDVGVRFGSPWLYDVFKDKPFVLVDPQAEGEDILAWRPEKYVFVHKAVGRKPGRLTLNDQESRSTFLERTELAAAPTRRRYDVDVTTLDAVIGEHARGAKHIGLKVDTEGFEMEAFAGLVRHTGRIDFIATEASVLNRFKDGYNFSELVAELWKKGFRFYNLLNQTVWPVPPVYDGLFFHKDDPIFDKLA